MLCLASPAFAFLLTVLHLNCQTLTNGNGTTSALVTPAGFHAASCISAAMCCTMRQQLTNFAQAFEIQKPSGAAKIVT
jgi:hypothetical protein